MTSACSQATTPPETKTTMATAAMTIDKQVLERVEPVIVAGLGQAERRQHHHAHAGAEEAAIDGGRELYQPNRAAAPSVAGLPGLGFGFSQGPAANSAVAASSSHGTSARKDGLSSASRISAPASAPTAEMSAQHQRAAPESA